MKEDRVILGHKQEGGISDERDSNDKEERELRH